MCEIVILMGMCRCLHHLQSTTDYQIEEFAKCDNASILCSNIPITKLIFTQRSEIINSKIVRENHFLQSFEVEIAAVGQDEDNNSPYSELHSAKMSSSRVHFSLMEVQ